MSDIRVRGTSDPAEIAAVLAVLGRYSRQTETTAPRRITAWVISRRAALARNPWPPGGAS